MFYNILFVLLCRYVYVIQQNKPNYYVIRKNWYQCRSDMDGSGKW